MEVEIDLAGQSVILTYDNTWVCLFSEAPSYDHLYVYDPHTYVVFECRDLLTKLLELGFPFQTRHKPTSWDEKAMKKYVHQLASNLDDELDSLEEP